MLISGHIGLTLAIFNLINRKKKNLSYQTACVLAFFALLPDILDRTLNYTIIGYPNHGIFHSFFFYFAALLICYLFFRKAFTYIIVMGVNVFFDIVNASPRAFIYPLNQLFPSIQRHVQFSPVESFMAQLPAIIRYKLPTGHFAIFELAGLLFIVLTLIDIGMEREKEIVHRRDAQVPSDGATGQAEAAEKGKYRIQTSEDRKQNSGDRRQKISE